MCTVSGAAALALTSRRMYEVSRMGYAWNPWWLIAGPRISNGCNKPDTVACTAPEDRYRLLQLLQRDIRNPSLELCPFCRVFHRRRTERNPAFNNHPYLRPLRPQTACPWLECSGPRWWHLGSVTFRNANEAMNRYRRGLPKEQALAGLFHSSDWTSLHPDTDNNANTHNNANTGANANTSAEGGQPLPHPICRQTQVKLDTEATVINNELHLAVTQRLWFPVGSERDIGRVVGPLRIQTCCHEQGYRSALVSSMTDLLEGMGAEAVASAMAFRWDQTWSYPLGAETAMTWYRREAQIDRKHTGGLSHWDRMLLHPGNLVTEFECSRCPTTIRVQVREHKPWGVEAVITTWQNLGGCSMASQDVRLWEECWAMSACVVRHADCDFDGRLRIFEPWGAGERIRAQHGPGDRRMRLSKKRRTHTQPGVWGTMQETRSELTHPSAMDVIRRWKLFGGPLLSPSDGAIDERMPSYQTLMLEPEEGDSVWPRWDPQLRWDLGLELD